MLFRTRDTLAESLKTAETDLKILLGLDNTVADLQTGASYSLNFSYIKPVSDKLTVTPSLSVSRMYYKKGYEQW